MTAAPSGAQDYPGVKLRGLPLLLSPPAISENPQPYVTAQRFLHRQKAAGPSWHFNLFLFLILEIIT